MFCLQKNVLLACRTIDCIPYCNSTECNHSVIEIVNINFNKFSLISNEKSFLETIREFLIQNVRFHSQICEHVEILKKIIIKKYVSVVSKYYFSFLCKIGKDVDLPSQYDELMKIVYAAHIKYKKKQIPQQTTIP